MDAAFRLDENTENASKICVILILLGWPAAIGLIRFQLDNFTKGQQLIQDRPAGGHTKLGQSRNGSFCGGFLSLQGVFDQLDIHLLHLNRIIGLG
ncbi:hypothetical protein D3C75_962290 [compost metagenome]